jgi:ABC-type lipoprotein release transport system permease subunit
MLATAVAAALAVGLVAGIVPAWRASRLRAVQAMRDGA